MLEAVTEKKSKAPAEGVAEASAEAGAEGAAVEPPVEVPAPEAESEAKSEPGEQETPVGGAETPEGVEPNAEKGMAADDKAQKAQALKKELALLGGPPVLEEKDAVRVADELCREEAQDLMLSALRASTVRCSAVWYSVHCQRVAVRRGAAPRFLPPARGPTREGPNTGQRAARARPAPRSPQSPP